MESSNDQQPSTKASEENTKENVILTGISSPHSNDVLCGRGVTTNRHKGNEKFREIVDEKKNVYVESTKRQKMSISRSIVAQVRNLDPPGRFLEKNHEDGLWHDIGDKKAAEKTAQALRDRAANFRKSLNEETHQSPTFDNTSRKKEASDVPCSNAITGQGNNFDQWDIRSGHMSSYTSYNVGIKQKTSFDPSVRGWGSYYGHHESYDASYMMRKNRHRRSNSTPDARERHNINMGRNFYEFPQNSFQESSQGMYVGSNKEGEKKAHRRSRTLPVAPASKKVIEPINEHNEFEPIPFSRNRRHSLIDEKRLSKDIFDPAFLNAIFDSNGKAPFVESHGTESRQHEPSYNFIKKSSSMEYRSSNAAIDGDSDWNMEVQEKELRNDAAYHPVDEKIENSSSHRKRPSGDFSDKFAGAFSKPFNEDPPINNPSPLEVKSKSTLMAFTSTELTNPRPPAKKYRPVTGQSANSFNFNHTPPVSPRVENKNDGHDLTRDQFSYIAQGPYNRNDSFTSATMSPHQKLYEENNMKEDGEFSEQIQKESSPTTVFDDDQNLPPFVDKFDYETAEGVNLTDVPFMQPVTHKNIFDNTLQSEL